MTEFGLTLMVFGILLLIRNEVTYRIRMKALAIVFSQQDWEQALKRMENKSYDAILFDITCWTTKKAYPWLFEK